MAAKRTTRQSSSRQRTAPYLGVACLALLAFASVHAFAPEFGAGMPGRAAALPALSWLAAPAAAPVLLGTTTRFALHAASQATAQVSFAGAVLLTIAIALTALLLRRATPLTRGGLSIPALLVAIALARAH
ncbi:MAG TPA: hypothetical protein VGN32_08385 [Ktedonobacterales bacterium]|nr:hypothetical protein [Ktedonobacterales bacterium]